MELLLPRLLSDTSLRLIRTQAEDVVIATPDERIKSIRRRCGSDITFVPVVEKFRTIGLIKLSDPLDDRARAQEVMRGSKEFERPRATPVVNVLSVLASGQPILTLHRGRLDGIVTFADLNRRAFRVLLYAHIAEVEGRLAEILHNMEPDPDRFWNRWGQYLSQRTKQRWADEAASDLFISATELLELSDLSEIIQREPVICGQIGFTSRTQAKRVLGSLVSLRHTVMHPVRPVVRHPKDVRKLADKIESLGLLIEQTRR